MAALTPEQRHAAALKSGETRRRNIEIRAERDRLAREDKEQRLAVLRSIRDDETATPAERLKAVELIEELTNWGRLW